MSKSSGGRIQEEGLIRKVSVEEICRERVGRKKYGKREGRGRPSK